MNPNCDPSMHKEEERQSEIPCAVDRLRNNTAELNAMFRSLRSALEPVMQHERPSVDGAEDKQVYESPLGEDLHLLANELDRLLWLVNDILQRVAL